MALSELDSGEPGVYPRVAWVGRASWGSSHGDVRDGVWAAGEVAWVGRLVCDEAGEVWSLPSVCFFMTDFVLESSQAFPDLMSWQGAFSLKKGLSPTD